MPSNFIQRLGKRVFDTYFSGTYSASDGTRIGYLRIPDFASAYLPDLDREIKYFQANTDVLVVDVMRNPGGSPYDVEDAISRLTPRPYQGAVAEFHVTWIDVVLQNEGVSDATYYGADDETIAFLQLYQAEFQDAFMNKRGRTKPLPVTGSTLARTPVSFAYTKPVLVLADELSASAAEMFASLMQDNHIAPIFGYRTMGAGGVLLDGYLAAGIYSEGSTTVTRGLMIRQQPVVTPDYPTTSYVENVGVRPDIAEDFMTADNLVNNGAAFVKAFTDAAVQLAKGGK
jgi:C-terminal processing protease CtpA/Prc